MLEAHDDYRIGHAEQPELPGFYIGGVCPNCSGRSCATNTLSLEDFDKTAALKSRFYYILFLVRDTWVSGQSITYC